MSPTCTVHYPARWITRSSCDKGGLYHLWSSPAFLKTKLSSRRRKFLCLGMGARFLPCATIHYRNSMSVTTSVEVCSRASSSLRLLSLSLLRKRPRIMPLMTSSNTSSANWCVNLSCRGSLRMIAINTNPIFTSPKVSLPMLNLKLKSLHTMKTVPYNFLKETDSSSQRNCRCSK